MKLESLHIKNYKLFKDLEIPKLGQVNLITGRNNTGKTILLEALRIWASEGDASVINNIIWKRGDWDEGSNSVTYYSLIDPSVYLGPNEQGFIINDLYVIAIKNSETNYLDSIIALKSFTGKKNNVTAIRKELVNEISMNFGNKEYPNDKALFVPASTEFDNTKLWSSIELTDKEEWVVKILKIIEPNIQAIGIINNVARVRTKNSKTPVPLKNFGEGLNRLLTIAMALVSAEDNLLLIDEIEIGLHHTVQKQLWEIIFEFAKKLNVQVFATTHSDDCIKTFYSVSAREEFATMGKYYRLAKKRGSDEIGVVEYELDELEVALESNIETR